MRRSKHTHKRKASLRKGASPKGASPKGRQSFTTRLASLRKGGSMIAQGTYGCGFIPALKCKGNAERRPNTFSKLMIKAELNKEIESVSIIARIDPDQKYSVYHTATCELNKQSITPENKIDNCKLYKKHAADSILQMPIGGEQLDKVILDEYDIVPYLKSMRNLIIGLKEMHSAGYYHLDIKPANILCKRLPTTNPENPTFLTRFIDFGMSRTTEQFIAGHTKYPMQSNYRYWPFDFRFLAAYLNNMEIEDARLLPGLSDMLNEFYNESLSEKRFGYLDGFPYMPYGSYFKNKQRIYTPSMAHYVFRHLEKKYKEDPINAVNEQLARTDIYGLGITMAEIFYKSTGLAFKRGYIYNLDTKIPVHRKLVDIAIRFYECIYGMIILDTRLVASYDTLLMNFDKIMDDLYEYNYMNLNEPAAKSQTEPAPAPPAKKISGASKYLPTSPLPASLAPASSNKKSITKKRSRSSAFKYNNSGSTDQPLPKKSLTTN
jgi:serine/threonine protein kinase